jgi:hypothetical protein
VERFLIAHSRNELNSSMGQAVGLAGPALGYVESRVKGKRAAPAVGNRPKSKIGERKSFPFIKPFILRICSGMNATNNYLFKFILGMFTICKIKY